VKDSLRDLLRPASAGRISFYRLQPVSVTQESASMTEGPPNSQTQSARVADAESRAELRLRHQRGTLRPLGVVMIVAVMAATLGAHPRPAVHGTGIGVAVALGVFIAALALAIGDRFTGLGIATQAIVIAAMGAAGIALVALQPKGATSLAGAAAVWMAVARLPLPLGVGVAAVTTAGLDLAAGLGGSSPAAVLATTLLCVLLALIAYFLKQARASQDRTEVLLAQLEDAREEQTRAAAVAERGRIASELHDVLAHSLSGAAIQLQGARMLAEREHAEAGLRCAIERASELVKDGLADARQAVGALRGDELPGIEQLPSLIARLKDDMNVDATLSIEGAARALPAEAGLALYRGAQEALTNVARYAPGASTTVVVRYAADCTALMVEDRVPITPHAGGGVGLAHVGGGRGLAGMRERIELAGGTMRAGPTDDGWVVELEVPA
jgi:signal transduction histidine kinase